MSTVIFTRRKLSALLLVATMAATGFVATSKGSAQAAECAPVQPKGKTIGKISVDSLTMPIKSFSYPAGGVMEPQGTTLAAGLSNRHMPLSSSLGSSLLVWHKNYNGCGNVLNVLGSKALGSTIKIVDEKGKTKKYSLAMRRVITKGDYDPSWFDLIGPRKIVMVTCTGQFKDGHYESNLVIIATPV